LSRKGGSIKTEGGSINIESGSINIESGSIKQRADTFQTTFTICSSKDRARETPVDTLQLFRATWFRSRAIASLF